MSGEIKTPKVALVDSLTKGLVSPQDAVKQFESMPPSLQKNGRIYAPKDLNEKRLAFDRARELRATIRESRLPFISEHFLPGFYLSQGLIVVGGESGRAKSTTAANVLCGFLRHERHGRSAFVVSNEEATDAVLGRAACIATRTDFTQFFRGDVSKTEEARVLDYVHNELVHRVEVVEDPKYDMAYLEDVQSVLESAATNNVGLVIIDYLQVITQSRENPNMEAFQVSKQFGLYLKEYGRKYGIPVVCFAQLYSNSKGPTMAERIQNDKTFFNHGFACIEVIPNFENSTTTFKLHKDRFFGHTGKEIICDFKGGRYEFAGETNL